MRLKGRTALVTGASRGIGRAIAEVFASEGAQVAIADIDLPAARETAEAIACTYAARVIALQVDVASQADSQAMVESTVNQLGSLDILVCNAGIVRKGRPIEEIPADDWRQTLDVNLMGCVFATQAFVPHAKQRGGTGRIVYIASVAGEMGGIASDVPYAVSKAAVIGLTKAVARQLAPFQVTVNAIAPGAIETAMTDVLQYPPSVKAGIPLQHYGATNDIARAALYLASDDAGYVTGATLDVNGGILMR